MKKAVSFILVIWMLVSMTACAKNPEGIKGLQTESTGAPANQTTSVTDAEKTEPSATKPLPSETEGTEPEGSDPIYSTDELKEMDATKKSYGPGTKMDEKNRPVGATTLQGWYGKYDAYFIAPDNSNFYLTFDEGYENGYTTVILDTLKEKNVQAVFFVTLPYCKKNPELIRRMIAEGHAVGNHSVSHLSMPTLSIEKMVEEVMELHEYVKEHFGYEMHLFRPPMGEYSVQSLAVLQNLGYKTVQWSFAYRDYDTENQMPPEEAYEKVVGAVHGGGIFLLHAVSKTNAEILGDVIDEFRRQGYDLLLFS